MRVYDYRIVECFDFDEMSVYYLIQYYDVSHQEYILYSPKRIPHLLQAQEVIRMLRKYKEPIYHYVE